MTAPLTPPLRAWDSRSRHRLRPSTSTPPGPVGWVSFAGSGRGKLGLLTVSAVELIESAHLVLTESPESVGLRQAAVGIEGDPEMVRERIQVHVTWKGTTS